jgi:hypothetical protein
MRTRIPRAKWPLGEIEEYNKTSRWLRYDGKGEEDEKGRAFQTASEKVVPHLA